MADAGWKADPNGRHEWRYFDGATWTDQVSDAGQTSVDRYDPTLIPPPPSAPLPPPAAVPKQVEYRLVLLDRKSEELHNMRFQSPDSAVAYAENNPELELKKTMGSVLMRGAFAANPKRWRTAIVLEVDQTTGQQSEYQRMQQR